MEAQDYNKVIDEIRQDQALLDAKKELTIEERKMIDQDKE